MRETELGHVLSETPAIALVGNDSNLEDALDRTSGQQGQDFYPVVAVGDVHLSGQSAILHVGYNLAFTPISILVSIQPMVFEDTRGEPPTLAVEVK